MNQPTSIIELKALSRAFDGRTVLHDLTLSFPKGLTTVVMGPSGCGKSVMLKHIIGLLKPDSGELWFQTHRIDTQSETDLSALRRRFGMLFQQAALFDSMNVHDNVAFPLLEAGWPEDRIDARVLEVLSLVGLADTLTKLPAELSGGMRKRIGLARAIVLSPEVILYDEPTTGLDPIRADVINELILRLKQRLGVTSIVVTHDLVSAYKVADYMVLLHGGRVQLAGTPNDFRASTDPIVVGFLEGRAASAELIDTPIEHHS
jgi:phospholipid/cholesterol/gamma-HCH transport system ATP-binding protein